MKIIKPLKMGALYRIYGYGKANRFTISPMIFFRLGTGEPLSEHLQWPVALSCPGLTAGLDIGMPKRAAEVLISGQAYAPGGDAAPEITVGFKVGSVAKELRVVGDRQWRRHGLKYRPSEPERFAAIPLINERSFGGPDFADNPAGRGYNCVKNGDFRLPNIERPDEPIADIDGWYAPENFLPGDLSSPARQKKAGTYDDSWLAEDFPGFPKDIDWSLFNVAREDQRADAFFLGTEPYEIRNMHPEKPVISGVLPRLRTRAFIEKTASSGGEFIEIRTVIDTLWFFPHKELGLMIFRGQREVRDGDGLDVATCMLAFEKIGDAARSVDYYRRIMKLRSDPKTAAAHVFNDSQLSPEKTPEFKERMNRIKNQAEEKASADRQAAIDSVIDEMFGGVNAKMPEGFNRPAAAPPLLPVIPQEAVENADFDLSETIEKAESAAQAAKVDAESKLREAGAKIEALLTQSKKRAAGLQEKNKRIESMEKYLPGNNDETGKAEAALTSLFGPDKTADKEKYKARLFADAPLVGNLSNAEADYLGEIVKKLLAAGKSLSGLDCAGARLAGVDFSGCDLKGAMLEYADLRGCIFGEARCEGAVFTAAILETADFAGADLTSANLSAVKAEKTNFSGCVMKNVILNKGVFRGSRFENALLTGVLATGASCDDSDFRNVVCEQGCFVASSLRNSDWSGSKLEKIVLIETDMAGAAFRNSAVSRCAFIDVAADGADFSGASMKQVQAGGTARFTNGRFENCRMEECGFRGANMSGIRAQKAAFIKSDLGNADLTDSDLPQASLLRSMLYGAKLKNADLRRADLFESIVKKADFSKANLHEASLYNVQTLEADFTDCVYADSPVRRRERL